MFTLEELAEGLPTFLVELLSSLNNKATSGPKTGALFDLYISADVATWVGTSRIEMFLVTSSLIILSSCERNFIDTGLGRPSRVSKSM
mmetsp:Transcript_40830/g.73730  ORF Transcript_40830/g.73730 Transcript_40830/m.73730 type:complete len:88 (+) Transcript_40830:1128-1391(+)